MTQILKIATIIGGLGFGLSLLGCFGGNRIIGIAQGCVISSLLLLGWAHLQKGGKFRSFRKVKVRSSWVALACLFFVYLISVFLNWEAYTNPFRDLKKARYELIVLVVLLIPSIRFQILRMIRSQQWAFWLAWSGVLLVSLAGVIGRYSGFNPLLLGEPSHDVRVSGVSGTVMTFSYSLQFFVLLSSSLLAGELIGEKWGKRLIQNDFKRRLLLGGTFLFLFTVLFLCFCRGALLGVVIGLAVLLFVSKNVKTWIVVGLIVAGTLVYGYQSGSRYFKNYRIESGFSLQNDSIRFVQWKTACLAFFDNPISGLGHRQFEKQASSLKKKFGIKPDNQGAYFEGHAHNNYFEAFASNGIFGGLAFIAFCLLWFHEMLKSNYGRLYFLPVVAAFIVSGFFENTFTDSEVLHTILLIYFVSQIVLDTEAGDGSVAEVS